MKPGARARSKSAGPRTTRIAASSASGSAARNASTRALTASAGSAEPHDLQAGDARRGVDHGPARIKGDLVRPRSRSPLEFAQRAGGEVDLAVEDVVRVGRAGGKIGRAGVGGVGRHLAEQEGAVGADQRRHRKGVGDRRVGKTEVAPGEEGGEIGLEIFAAERRSSRAGADRVASQQQHAAIVEPRLPGDARAPVVGDARRLGLGERPRARGEAEVERVDRENARGAHRSIVPSATSTAGPPIVAALSAPRFDVETERDAARPAHLDALSDDQKSARRRRAGRSA